MEAWMERAAKKHLHLPWTGKRRDLLDEEALRKMGYTEAQVAAQSLRPYATSV